MSAQTETLIEDLIMIVGMRIIKDVKSMLTKIRKTIIRYLLVQRVTVAVMTATVIVLEEILNITDQEIDQMVQDIEVGINIKGMISGMKNDLVIIIKTFLGEIRRSWMTQNTQGLRRGSPMIRRPGDSRTDISRNLESGLMIKVFYLQRSQSLAWIKTSSTARMVVTVTNFMTVL